MKRIVSLLLVLSVVFALGMTAMAAEEKAAPEAPKYTITIQNPTPGHTYEAYQIFAATLSKDGKILSDVKWGTGVTQEVQTAMGNAADKVLELTDEGKAKNFAKEVAKYLNSANAKKSSAVDGNNYTIGNLEAGYYLVKDTDGSVTGHDSYTAYIMQVVGDKTVSPKSGVAQVEKKVKDINDTTGAMTEWQDSADYDVNDEIPFQLKATLAPNVDAYNTYKVVFHDTLSEGLTYKNVQKITIDGNEVTSHFTVTHTPEGNKLTISCDDVKAQGARNDSVIIVEYTATLNDKAVLGSKGNPNTVHLEFSNNPNYAGEAAASPMGKTPEDKVMIFTYQVEVNKVNEKDQPLQGAGFTLYKKYKDEAENEGYRKIGEEKTGGTTFNWTGLDDGEYKLVETTTPDGYNTMKDVLFTIDAAHDEVSENPALNTLTGGDTFTGAVDTGKLTAQIVNKPGVQLPSTGGVGTTIFYIAGGVLVLLSGVVLLTKKRSYEQA